MADEKREALAPVAEEASACQKCPLAETRTLVVFGEGNPDSPLLIVGEGPGEREDLTGRPFVGRAGALLDECLAENRITRKHVYITNIVKCRACSSENSRKRNRPPSTAETNACRPYLDRQLEIIRPRVVLCLGSPSANALIHTNFRIMQERGRFFEVPFADYAIAALHPAYILRQGGQAFRDVRATLVADIGAARLKVVEIRKAEAKTLF
mgnify:CR=1 FL=1|jgi:DNA polymerase